METGLKELDKKIEIKKSELVLFSTDTSSTYYMIRNSLMFNIANNTSTEEIPVLIFSPCLLKKHIKEQFPFSNFLIDDNIISITEIEQKSRKLKEKNKIELIVVENLQNIPIYNSKAKSREGEENEILIRLKQLAKELNVVIFVYSDLLTKPKEIKRRDDITNFLHYEVMKECVSTFLRLHIISILEQNNGKYSKIAGEITIFKNNNGIFDKENIKCLLQ